MAVTSTTILEKQSGEKRQYSIDFSNLMSTSETIPGDPTVTSEKRGEGATDLTITGVAASGQTAVMWIAGGTANETYRVQATITTSSGAILVGDGLLRVRDK